ncbi:MAG: autotransporter domain-containing protein [Sphingomicrobium sp.]
MTKNRLLAAALLAASALSFAAPANAQRIERIVAFGDSYADDGNFFQLVGINPATTQVYTTGRFSGGTNYIDTLGQLLSVPIDNFAIGGALTDNRNTNGPPLGFVTEYASFLGGGGPAAFPRVSGTFGPDDLLAVSIGGNDARFYQQTGGTLAGAPAAANASAAFATTGLNALVGAGARNISFLAGDTGRLPEIAGNPSGAAIRSAFSTTFNAAIQSTLSGYAANGVIVHYLDLNRVLDSVTGNFGGYGLTGLACPAFPNPACVPGGASDPFLFYGDQLHLTSAGFRIVARYIVAQLEAPLTLQASSDMGLDVARQFGRTLTTRMDLGAPRDGDMPEGLKFFVVGDTVTRSLDTGQRNNAYRSTSVGGTIGAEYGFGSGVVGLAANYSKPRINFTGDAADVDGKSVQVGGYAGFGIAGGFVQAYGGYGWDKNEIERTGVVQGMEANPKGRHALFGAKAGYLMPMGTIRVGPVVALDYARSKVDGYTESGDPALTLNVSSLKYSSLRGSAGLEVRGDFGGGGIQLRPYGAATVEKDFTGDSRTIRFSQTASPTIVNSFAFDDASKKAYGRFSGGFSAAIFSSVSLDVAGSATVGKDQGEETSAHVGLRIGF